MATYFKYAEREADSYVNWAEIGKNMSDMLKEETRIREEKKAAIDEASRQYGEQLANAPQGDHKGMNQWALEYGSDASQARLMQDKLLKSGQLKLKDYMVMRQNITDGTNQAFDLMKEYQTEYTNKIARMKADKSQDLEPWLMGEAEGFANFSKTKLYINPTDGTVSVAKTIKGPDGVINMSDNPNDFTTVNALRNRMKGHFDKFDVKSNVGAYVQGLGEEISVLTDIKNKYKRGTVTEILDITERSYLSEDEKGVLIGFEDAEKKMLLGMMSNDYHTSSILTNELNFEKETGKEYTYTWNSDPTFLKNNPELILLKNDPNSDNPVPQFSEAQKEAAFIYLRTQARLMYDKTEKVTVIGASEKAPEQQWQYLARLDKQRKESVFQSWQDLYTGDDARVQAATDAILGLPESKEEGLIGISRGKYIDPKTNKEAYGVTFKYADPNKNRSIPFTDANLNIKSSNDWFKSGTEVFGEITDSDLNRFGKGDFGTADYEKSIESSRDYKGTAAAATGPSSKDLWNAAVDANKDMIEGYILSSAEELSVTKMAEILEGSGFSVEESGVTNNLVITAPDNVTKIEVGTNEGDVDERRSDATMIMNFLKANMSTTAADEWNKSGGGVGGKYNDK